MVDSTQASLDELVARERAAVRRAPRRVGLTGLVVGIVLAFVVSLAAGAAGIAISVAEVSSVETPHELAIGPVTVLVSDAGPPTPVLVAAVLALVAIAFGALAFEGIAALLAIDPRRRLLGSYRRVRGADAGQPGPVRVTVVIPAHNEEATLPATLAGLQAQTRRPERVIVVADNCTDGTVQVARGMGAEAFETVDNAHKKGGALNQLLGTLLPGMGASDAVLVIDADTVLLSRFIEVATARLDADPELAAVGGRFLGEDGAGVLGQFQRNEYLRYSTQISARRGRVFVLTGTATMFRADALLDVAAARGVALPGESGRVYDTAALTEDNELTLALKSLGATMISPDECQVVTEIMPTWRALWIQRKRWQRGALENLNAYGITAGTIRYWGQQVGIGYGTVALNSALLLFLITVLAVDAWIWFPFWLAVTAIFLIERVATVWRGGWRARLLALSLVPELLYDVFLQIVFVTCLVDIARNRQARWGHVQRGTP